MNKSVFGAAAVVAVALALGGVVPLEFIFFGLTLVGVGCFHHKVLPIAVTGMITVMAYKLTFIPTFHVVNHIHHEWRLLLNILGLLVGFEVLSNMFGRSNIPKLLPKWLPNDWKGPLVLLVLVFVLSSFLDNIAAAMIGGTIAGVVFQRRVHIGYLAAIVAASNAGGAGSVVGDTTTTMMWIDGVAAVDVLHAFVASFTALLIFGIPAAILQDRHQRILADEPVGIKVEWKFVRIVASILVGAILTNVYLDFPALGVWAAILGAVVLGTHVEWHELPKALKGACFLLSLVMAASMMPVESLPPASWQSAFGLGFVSAVFDNIPLTKLALDQGGFDWGLLAFAVGFGGSMIWFGSSAGVALTNDYPEARSVAKWLRHGWFVAVAYVVAFFVQLAIMGWQPHAPHRDGKAGRETPTLTVPAEPTPTEAGPLVPEGRAPGAPLNQ